MKDIFKYKEFRSKLDIENNKISSYIENGNLMIENVIHDFSNYIYIVSKNLYYSVKDEDIEEIIVDVIFAIWKNKDKLDINKKMSSYIAGITKNLLRKKYRDEKKLDNISDNIEDYEEKLIDFTYVQMQYNSEMSSSILKQVELLKSEEKSIFISYYYEEKSVKEIAKILSMSEAKVKSMLYRIRKKMKKVLKESGYDLNDR